MTVRRVVSSSVRRIGWSVVRKQREGNRRLPDGFCRPTDEPIRRTEKPTNRLTFSSMSFLDPRLTERRNPKSVDIDLLSPVAIADLINDEDATVIAAVRSQREEIARAIEVAEATFRRGGRLFYVGAGTSGRLGVLDASE